MSLLIQPVQIELRTDVPIRVDSFTANGTSDVVTTQITAGLVGASKTGGDLPNQLGSATQGGILVDDKKLTLVDATSQKPLEDGSGNEIYAKLTEATGVYTLSYYTDVNGVDTAHDFTSATDIDFYYFYKFELGDRPDDSAYRIHTYYVQNDTGGGNQGTFRSEVLTVTATNTLSALSRVPTNPTTMDLIINTATINAQTGAFTTVGTTVTLNQPTLPYDVPTNFTVVAQYFAF